MILHETENSFIGEDGGGVLKLLFILPEAEFINISRGLKR